MRPRGRCRSFHPLRHPLRCGLQSGPGRARGARRRARPREATGWRIIRRMQPREETITVGGIDVRTWVGGHGDPLLVLHGAGGNRGWTRWVAQVAEHYTVWAPTNPGFGASGDAEWMEGIDDLARFYLW